jgi:hypothetical protein
MPQTVPSVLSRPVFHEIGEQFPLSMSQPADGLRVVHEFGYRTRDWHFPGITVPKGAVGRFRLVTTRGLCRNIPHVRTELSYFGSVPPGQWLLALLESFTTDGKGPVGVADPSWRDPSGHHCFPMVDPYGRRGFRLGDTPRDKNWRWLVSV